MSDWAAHVEAWSSPPVDDVGYLPSSQLLALSDAELRELVERMRTTRYQGWRNHNGLWRDVLGLDTTRDADVLDYGCGTGVEALEIALAGNRVALADISQPNIRLAARIRSLYLDQLTRWPLIGTHLLTEVPPFLDAGPESFDVVHCSGVLHHIQKPRPVVERFHQLLRPGGEVRLMLYSDHGWRQATHCEPPWATEAHPAFGVFVRHFDQVGAYADWYDAEKLEHRFGDLFDLARFEYLTPNQQYCGAVLRKKGG